MTIIGVMEIYDNNWSNGNFMTIEAGVNKGALDSRHLCAY